MSGISFGAGSAAERFGLASDETSENGIHDDGFVSKAPLRLPAGIEGRQLGRMDSDFVHAASRRVALHAEIDPLVSPDEVEDAMIEHIDDDRANHRRRRKALRAIRHIKKRKAKTQVIRFKDRVLN
jgi:hypothetical protein